MSNFRLTVSSIAARALLMVVPRSNYPDLADRVTDFLQDRGSVGMLIRRYEENGSIETVAYDYWSSRLEKSGARLEDLVTTTLIAVASSVVAGIIVEMWKGNFGPLKHLFSDRDHEHLAELSKQQAAREQDLLVMLTLYKAKQDNGGAMDAALATKLYEATEDGRTISDFIFAQQLGPVTDFKPLDHIKAVCLGLVETESKRMKGKYVATPYSIVRTGIPLSQRSAFGEVISFFDALGQNGSRDAISELHRELLAARLHEKYWPKRITSEGPSPKILILNERLFYAFRELDLSLVLRSVAGLISLDSDMTSHLAVFSRGLGVAAVSTKLTTEEISHAKFAYLSEGRIYLYFERPNLTDEEFTYLIHFNRLKHAP